MSHPPLPSLNALATVTLASSTVVVATAALLYRRFTRTERAPSG